MRKRTIEGRISRIRRRDAVQLREEGGVAAARRYCTGRFASGGSRGGSAGDVGPKLWRASASVREPMTYRGRENRQAGIVARASRVSEPE